MAEINYIDLAWKQHQAEEELEIQRRIVLARDLYEGSLEDALITELEGALLSQDASNIVSLFDLYAVVVDEIADRLNVIEIAGEAGAAATNPGQTTTGQTATPGQTAAATSPAPIPATNGTSPNGATPTANGQPPAAAGPAPAPEWAMNLWEDNGLDEYQADVYRTALLDGESYIVLSPEVDPIKKVAVIRAYPHERYTSAEVEGTNEGVRFHYADDVLTLNRDPDFASKRWIETYTTDGGETESRQRMTLYIPPKGDQPGRVEKYFRDGSTWAQHKDEADPAWPIPWPYPLPVIRFRNTGGKQQGKRAQGGQVILNNLVTALVSAAGSVAVPPMVVIGGYPTTDGQAPAADGANVWRLGPRRAVGFKDKSPGQASIEFMRPGDISQIIDAINEVIKLMSTASGTPSLLAKDLNVTVAAKLLQQIDLKPVAAAKRVQNAFGNSWTKMFETAAHLISALTPEAADPEQRVEVIWMPADMKGFFFDEGEEKPTSDLTPEAEAVAVGEGVAQ